MQEAYSEKLLPEPGKRTEDAECNLTGEVCNLANYVLILKVVWVSTIPRLESFNWFHGVPTSPLVQMWTKTLRCLVCMKDP